jgi:hypothetical protein
MSDWAVDQLLDQLQTDAERGDEGARELFNALYAAQRQAMGSLHIPRVTSLRSGPTLIVNNDPTAVVRRMLERSVEEINGPGAA